MKLCITGQSSLPTHQILVRFTPVSVHTHRWKSRVFLNRPVIAIKLPFILCPFSLFVFGFAHYLRLLQPFITLTVNTYVITHTHTHPHTLTHTQWQGDSCSGDHDTAACGILWADMLTPVYTIYRTDRKAHTHTQSGWRMKTFIQLRAMGSLWCCLAVCVGTERHIKVKSFMCVKLSD